MNLLKPLPSWLRSTWLLVPLGIIAIYLIGKWQGSIQQRDNEILSSAHLILKAGKAYRAHYLQLLEMESSHVHQANTHSHNALTILISADSLSKLDSALDAQLSNINNVRDSNRVLLTQNNTLRQENRTIRDAFNEQMQAAAHLQIAIKAADDRADLANHRADTLEYSLKRVLKVEECKILFLKCPSRTVTFFVGAAGGFVLSELVAKKG